MRPRAHDACHEQDRPRGRRARQQVSRGGSRISRKKVSQFRMDSHYHCLNFKRRCAYTEGTASEYCGSYRDTSVGLSTTQRLLSRDSNDRFVITVSEICRQRHTAKIFESITCRYLLSSLDWFVVSNFPVATRHLTHPVTNRYH